MPFLGLEAIDHQGKSKLAIELEDAIAELQKKKEIGMQDIDNSGLSKIITKHLNILNRVIVKPGLDARMFYDTTIKNHIFNMDEHRDYYEEMVAGAALMERGGFRGTIDLKTGWVDGDFAKVFTQIVIGEEFLKNGSKYLPSEVAAILLHEIGHMHTIFEMTSRYTKTNLYMDAALKRILNSETKEQRIQILGQLENLYGEKIDDMERIAEIKKHKDYYRTVFMSVASKESINQLGYNVYDMRACEQVADQFASRHGMGRPLATGLDKMYRDNGDRAYYNTFVQSLLFIIEIMMAISLAMNTFGLSILVAGSMMYNNYDPIPRRMEKIKHDAIDYLKDKSLTKKERDRVLLDITVIEGLMSEMKDNYSFNEFLWTKVLPWGRATHNKVIFNEELERMLNNSLFTSSAILRT